MERETLQNASLLPSSSYLDGEPSGTEVPLLQVQPPLLAEQKLGMESDVDHTHLYQLVAMQQEELKQLREDQQRGFLALQQQLDMVQRSLLEHQQLSLTEHAREQRIPSSSSSSSSSSFPPPPSPLLPLFLFSPSSFSPSSPSSPSPYSP